MKSAIPFIVALSAATSLAFAQEESPSPAAEENPSANVEESPAMTASPESTPASAAAAEAPVTKKKESAPVTSGTTAPTAKKATTAQKPAAAAAAAKPGKKMSVEATLKDNENRWESSYAAHDASVAQSLVANDFTGVYWDGKIMSKSGVLGQIKKDKDTYKTATNEKLSVRSYGPDCSVVIGTAHEKGTGKDGKAFDRSFRFTDTWVMRNGQWQCVSSHVMKLKG